MNEHNINEVDGLAGGHDAMGSVQRAVKRLFDVAFSLVGMILASPICLVIAACGAQSAGSLIPTVNNLSGETNYALAA